MGLSPSQNPSTRGLLPGAVADASPSYFRTPPVSIPIQISQPYKPPTGIPCLLQPWEPSLTQSLSQGRLPWSQESREQHCWNTPWATSPLVSQSSSSCGRRMDMAMEPWWARLCSSHLQGSPQVRAALAHGTSGTDTEQAHGHGVATAGRMGEEFHSELEVLQGRAGEQLPAPSQALVVLHNHLTPLTPATHPCWNHRPVPLKAAEGHLLPGQLGGGQDAGGAEQPSRRGGCKRQVCSLSGPGLWGHTSVCPQGLCGDTWLELCCGTPQEMLQEGTEGQNPLSRETLPRGNTQRAVCLQLLHPPVPPSWTDGQAPLLTAATGQRQGHGGALLRETATGLIPAMFLDRTRGKSLNL